MNTFKFLWNTLTLFLASSYFRRLVCRQLFTMELSTAELRMVITAIEVQNVVTRPGNISQEHPPWVNPKPIK